MKTRTHIARRKGPVMSRDELLNELDAAVEEIVTETRRLAWKPTIPPTTDDTKVIHDAADQLNRRLEH